MDFVTLHEKELEIIRSIQGIRNPFLDKVMLLLNHLDTFPSYILAITLLWFCYQRSFGIRLIFLFFITSFINQDAKELFAQPRPCQMDASLQMLKAKSFGIPSGAAQSMLVLFGYTAYHLRRAPFTYFSIFSVLLISFSRIYLGLHFFSDIAMGWILGALSLWTYIVYEPKMESFLKKKGRFELLILSSIISLILASLALNKNSSLVVFSSFGVMVGLALTKTPLKDPRTWAQRLERPLLVLLGIAWLFMIIHFFPTAPSLKEKLFGKAIQFLAGFWISFLVNPLIKKIESYSFFR